MASPMSEPFGSVLTWPDWRAAIALRWQALGLDLLGLGQGLRRTPSELADECQALAILTVFFECRGNLTHTAARIGISRRACRDRLTAWARRNPHFEPPLPKWRPDAGRPRRHRAKLEVSVREAGPRGVTAKGQGSKAKRSGRARP